MKSTLASLMLILACSGLFMVFRPVPASAALLSLPTSRTIDDGYYAIRSQKNRAYAIGVSNDADQSVVLRHYVTDGSAYYQIWRFFYIGQGLYSVEKYKWLVA